MKGFTSNSNGGWYMFKGLYIQLYNFWSIKHWAVKECDEYKSKCIFAQKPNDRLLEIK